MMNDSAIHEAATAAASHLINKHTNNHHTTDLPMNDTVLNEDNNLYHLHKSLPSSITNKLLLPTPFFILRNEDAHVAHSDANAAIKQTTTSSSSSSSSSTSTILVD